MNLVLSTALVVSVFAANFLFAQEETKFRSAPDTNVLADEQWTQLDASVQQGLAWLATQQQDNGSFEAIDLGQPAVTSFCVMAFLAQGESPVGGEYKRQLTKAIDFIAAQQKPNGLLALNSPGAVPIPRVMSPNSPRDLGVTVVYNHAISALALCEAYGQCTPVQSQKLAPVIEKAIAATLEMQGWGGKKEHDVGGWRYMDLRFKNSDSDLSITGWQLMFLRSARNAGFDVPSECIDQGVQYVENCFVEHPERQVHGYKVMAGKAKHCTRAMAGAGVLAMAHAGKHNSKEAVASGEWILAHDFSNYNGDTPVYGSTWLPDRYHYGAIQCTQAMYQLGGKYWEQFFPPLVEILLANQQADGSWPPEKTDPQYGNCYTTSLCVLSLSVPNQILPIFQR